MKKRSKRLMRKLELERTASRRMAVVGFVAYYGGALLMLAVWYFLMQLVCGKIF